MEELINRYIKAEVNIYLKKWFNELGIEGTIEMIERCQLESVKNEYMEALRERGLIK